MPQMLPMVSREWVGAASDQDDSTNVSWKKWAACPAYLKNVDKLLNVQYSPPTSMPENDSSNEKGKPPHDKICGASTSKEEIEVIRENKIEEKKPS